MSAAGPSWNNKRLGLFYAPEKMAREFSSDLKRVMGQCIIMGVEYIFFDEAIRYMALSEHFDPVGTGEELPTYTWIFDADGSLSCVRNKS